ncbi:hypothetical protein NMY22_g13428 [Coprinellus aureogranulatus]|nr:hypothetical protein NMY22_g13428 [Coprinellus aureogranulatus]
MSLRVRCRSDPTADDEYQNTVAPKSPSWTAAGSVFRAGRELSSWVFGKPTPSHPSHSTDCCAVASKTPAESTPLHHINALPQEMLEEIFRQYLLGLRVPGHPYQGLTGSLRHIVTRPGTSTTPFTLAHTCSLWRTIIMSNPSFWSKIAVCAARPFDFPLFEFWLSLSGDCPLDLTISQREAVDGVTQRILLTIMPHSSRWKSVTWRLEPDMEKLVTNTLVNLSLPQLERFCLGINNLRWSAEGVAQVSHLLSSGPCVRSASFELRMCDPSSLAATNWGRLSDVQFSHIQLVDLLQVLPQMECLQKLSIAGVHDKAQGRSAHALHPPMLLPHLTAISIERHNDLSPLWDSLTLPSLHTLHLGDGFGWGPGVETRSVPLAQLVKRSGCTVLTLHWVDSSDPATLIRILHNASTSIFPSLLQIKLGSIVNNDVVAEFTSGGLFPHLRDMELRDCCADHASLQELSVSRPLLRTVHN